MAAEKSPMVDPRELELLIAAAADEGGDAIEVLGDYLEENDTPRSRAKLLVAWRRLANVLGRIGVTANQAAANLNSSLSKVGTFTLLAHPGEDPTWRYYERVPERESPVTNPQSPMTDNCPDCKGSGRYQPLIGPEEDCAACGGTGKAAGGDDGADGVFVYERSDQTFSPPTADVVLRVELQCSMGLAADLFARSLHTVNIDSFFGWPADRLFCSGWYVRRTEHGADVDCAVDFTAGRAFRKIYHPGGRIEAIQIYNQMVWSGRSWQPSPECVTCPICRCVSIPVWNNATLAGQCRACNRVFPARSAIPPSSA